MTPARPPARRPPNPSLPQQISKPQRTPAHDWPRTLTEAHEALALIRPARQAPLHQWLAYYQRSAAWYAEIAEIDRGHHHEALYLAEHEREQAKKVKAQIATQQLSDVELREEVDGGEDWDGGSTENVNAGA
jgi:hypothetical protein